jgi:outer membrane protein W
MKLCTLTIVLGLLLTLAGTASAELYIAGDLGVTIPNNITNITATGAGSGTLTDLSLKESVLLGVKAGYYLPGPLKFVGIETEIFNTTPHIKQQGVTASGPGGTGTGTIVDTKLRVLTWAVNAVVRFPHPTFQPYVGVGPAIFFTRASCGGCVSDTSTKVGLNALAGLRVFVIPSWVALFGEYKYTRTTLQFDHAVTSTIGLKGDYSANAFVVGASLHF